MQIVWLRVLSVLFAALALIFSGAHLFELPHKIDMSAADYLTVQQIYRGWQFAGIVVFGALVSIGWLAYRNRDDRRVFVPTLIAFLCIVGTQVLFWSFNFPANRATDNWSFLPENWQTLRARWEYAHAASAFLNLGALVALLIALLGARYGRAPASQPLRSRGQRLDLKEVEP